MNLKKFKVGQGISMNSNGRISYGVVMLVNSTSISIVPVFKIFSDTKCYDDVDAIEKYHKDNVRLRDCPPPFSKLYASSDNGVYAYANIKHLTVLDEDACDYLNVDIVDNGVCLSDFMMEEIWNHPWQEQLQKEKFRHDCRIADLDNRFKFESDNDLDRDFGE